jgi:2-polyprenyl-3-methyl-5-hydroxy-6-metoxy-1,4-benzoquinol methylase
MIKKITNPIFKELIDLKIINKNKIKKISSRTRDKKISVYKCNLSGVIFLEKYITNSNYYKKIKYKYINKSNQKFYKIKILKGRLEAPLTIEDDKRRFFQFNKFIKNKKLLDFGCGWGNFLNIIKNAKLLAGVELREDCINFIKKINKKIFITNNLNSLKEKFNIITVFHVLEHIPFQIQTLRALRSKLSKNGKIIIEVPSASDFLLSFNEFKDFKKFTFWSEHLILHTEKSLRKVLIKSGFKKIKIQYFQRYNFANHLGWFIKKKPGGHNFYKDIIDNKINASYIDYLKRIKKTDSLIAIASN